MMKGIVKQIDKVNKAKPQKVLKKNNNKRFEGILIVTGEYGMEQFNKAIAEITKNYKSCQ